MVAMRPSESPPSFFIDADHASAWTHRSTLWVEEVPDVATAEYPSEDGRLQKSCDVETHSVTNEMCTVIPIHVWGERRI
jgi:hypothetical protein